MRKTLEFGKAADSGRRTLLPGEALGGVEVTLSGGLSVEVRDKHPGNPDDLPFARITALPERQVEYTQGTTRNTITDILEMKANQHASARTEGPQSVRIVVGELEEGAEFRGTNIPESSFKPKSFDSFEKFNAALAVLIAQVEEIDPKDEEDLLTSFRTIQMCIQACQKSAMLEYTALKPHITAALRKLAETIRKYPSIKRLYNNFNLLKDVENYFHYLINNGRKLTQEQAYFYESTYKFALAFRRSWEEFMAVEQAANTLKQMGLQH